MSKFNIEFSNSDFIDVVEETSEKIIIQCLEGSVTIDRQSAELIYNKLDEILHDETFAQLEAKHLDALNKIDELENEKYMAECASERDLDDVVDF